MHRRILLLVSLPFLLTACGARIAVSGGATVTPYIITATLEPTAIPSATLTPMPPTPSPTTVPVQGTTSTQVNVRGQPSTAAPSVHILPPFVNVQIVGSDGDLTWYQILDPQAPDGLGWVSSQFITVPQNKDKIPVIGGTATPTPGTGTPASGTPGASVTGTVIQQVNVRKGPGTTFDPLGTLNPNDTVTLIGKDPSGDWYQIAYGAAPDGKGWVAASFVEATGTENLPIVGAAGAIIGTRTPIAVVLMPTATPAPAFADRDSAQAPAATVSLSLSGTPTLLYSSDLSAPEGDARDWVQFTPSSPGVMLHLDCTGNGSLTVQFSQSSADLPGNNGPGCGQAKEAKLSPGKPCLVEVAVTRKETQPVYVHYTLEIRVVP